MYKKKIDSTFAKDTLKGYEGYRCKFIFISNNVSKLRKNSYTPPDGIQFDPQKDIYDVPSILNLVNDCKIDKLESLYRFFKKELLEIDENKIQSGLDIVISALAKENLDRNDTSVKIPFKIEEKITFNQLETSRDSIEKYFVHTATVDMIYEQYDRSGVNKSYAVLQSIEREYRSCKYENSADRIFKCVIEKVNNKAREHMDNSDKITIEELELYVGILVVNAFIRCKIFDPPPKNK